ncbi:MAG: transglutaminase family protein [Kiritimatiellia bacterium]
MFPGKTTGLAVEVEVVAEMSVFNPFDFFLDPAAEHLPVVYDPNLAARNSALSCETAGFPRFSSLVDRVKNGLMSGKGDPDGKPRTIDFLVALNQLLAAEIKYVIRLEPGVQSPEETLTLGSGSCRDTAWLLCQLLRHLGFAARFASGYRSSSNPT